MFNQIFCIFNLYGFYYRQPFSKKRMFLSVKPPRSGKTGVRVDFLGPLGYPAMEKNNKSYKNSVPSKEGLEGTYRYTVLLHLYDYIILLLLVKVKSNTLAYRLRTKHTYDDN